VLELSKEGRVSSSFNVQRLLVAVDGSDSAGRAANAAVDIAVKYSAELMVLHVMPRLTYEFVPVSLSAPALPPTGFGRLYDEAKKEAIKYVEEATTRAKNRGVDARGEVLENVPSIVQAITDYASQEKVDLIVVGTRGLSGFKKLLIGSVSNGVVIHAKQPVLVIR
jgi:nucleotide-binding universal stress UspA family protein